MSKLTADGLSVDYSGYIATFSGTIIEPLNPDPGAINIQDIAHALGNQCRFTGHTKYFYSVAQHSVLASHLASNDYKLWALLHDGTEAYLADMARPIKHQPGFGDVYRHAEDVLMEAIVKRFDLTDERPMPAEVKRVDDLLLASEITYLMPDHPIYDGWEEYAKLDEGMFEYWSPERAEDAFLNRYAALGGEYSVSS